MTKYDLDAIEAALIKKITKHSSQTILLSIKKALFEQKIAGSAPQQVFPNDLVSLPRFALAKISEYAVLHCNSSVGEDLTWIQLKSIIIDTVNFLTLDPIVLDKKTHDEFISSNPLPVMLRLTHNQLRYQLTSQSQHFRSYYLFEDCAKEINKKYPNQSYDVEHEFHNLTGFSIRDFLNVGLIFWINSSNSPSGQHRSLFSQYKQRGVAIPDDDGINLILNYYAADPITAREFHERTKQKNRMFRGSDLNLLLAYPILRPDEQSKLLEANNDKMISPLTETLILKLSYGPYYLLHDANIQEHGNRFTNWYGLVFEKYVDDILDNCYVNSKPIRGEEIILNNPDYSGKIPDWVIVEPSAYIYIECKATRYSLVATTSGLGDDVAGSLKQIIKGVKQINEFISRVKHDNINCIKPEATSKSIGLVVTHEFMPFLDGDFGIKFLKETLSPYELRDDVTWLVWPIHYLEILYPFIRDGLSLSEFINKLTDFDGFKGEAARLQEQSPKTFEDSFIYTKFLSLIKEINLRDE